MTSALIGYTGFIGSNLANSERFDLLINRANLESLRGTRLQRLVCAGLPAAKWLANRSPEEDWANLQRLKATLTTVSAETVILISTVDVYPYAQTLDETYSFCQKPGNAYGEHRLEFESFVSNSFPRYCIVRLPALFGRGLKKNVLYDLLTDNRLEQINPASRFQWYPLARLSRDLSIAEAHGLSAVNLVTEPIETRTVIQLLFATKGVGTVPDAKADYDLHTRHGPLFGGNSRYIMTSAAVMGAMREFVCAERILGPRLSSGPDVFSS